MLGLYYLHANDTEVNENSYKAKICCSGIERYVCNNLNLNGICVRKIVVRRYIKEHLHHCLETVKYIPVNS